MTTASKQPTLRSQAHLQGTQSPRRKTQPCKRACLHPRRPSYISLCIFNLLAWGLTSIYGQTPSSLTTFNRPTLSQLIQLPSTPQPATFQQIDINRFSTPTNQQTQLYSANPILGGQNFNQQQNNQQLQQYERDLQAVNARDQQLAEIKNDISQEKFYKDYMEWTVKTKAYQEAFKTFNKFNPDSFSISKAVFTVENAFLGNKYGYEGFEKALKQRAELVKQILKRENLNTKTILL